MRTDKELAKDGYLTIEQWIAKLSISLEYHLKESVFPSSKPGELFHPEDLVANSGAFLDAMMQILPQFGKSARD